MHIAPLTPFNFSTAIFVERCNIDLRDDAIIVDEDMLPVRVVDTKEIVRGHGDVIVGSSVKQATVYSAYVNINARMQMQAMSLSPNLVNLNEEELFTPEEFDINRPWEHFRQKALDSDSRA